jgi:hypothetical protein
VVSLRLQQPSVGNVNSHYVVSSGPKSHARVGCENLTRDAASCLRTLVVANLINQAIVSAAEIQSWRRRSRGWQKGRELENYSGSVVTNRKSFALTIEHLPE